MSHYPSTASGGCHCSAVRYAVSCVPDYVAYCHCEDCRKSTGAPAVVYAVYPAKNVTFPKGNRRTYESSPGVTRTFCGACGTPLSYEAEWKGDVVIGVFAGTLDTPDRFPPQKHVCHKDRLAWFDAADKLPRFMRVPTAGAEPDSLGPSL